MTNDQAPMTKNFYELVIGIWGIEICLEIRN